MKDARQKKIDAVVFFDLSRLTRRGIGHAIKILGDWKDAKVKPICFSYPQLDFTDESGMGEMMACMMAWMAAQEREMIRRRIKAGLAARKAKGKSLGRKRISLELQNRAIKLHGEGLSYRAVAKELSTAKRSISYNCVRDYVKASETA